MNFSRTFEGRGFQVSLICFLAYLALLAFSMTHHELWGDEIHSWNIAKASGTLSDLFQNIRYEGHPPLWYICLWSVSKLTHQAYIFQFLHFLFATFAIGVLLFKSPLPALVKALIPFGYYILYEYGTFSRNYALALVCCFSLLTLLRSKEPKPTAYYLLLFLLANTHLLGIILATSIQGYLILGPLKQSSGRVKTAHILFGVLCIAPAFIFIIPPADSELNAAFWIKIWNKEHLINIATSGLRSLFPMPTWWEFNFWNTHFLWHWAYGIGWKKLFVYVTSFMLIALATIVLRKDRISQRLFLLNLFITALIGLIFPLSSARYVGFIYIGFLAALWLHSDVSNFNLRKNAMLFLLLFLQIPGAIFAFVTDEKHPFSRATEIPKLIQKVPAGDSLISDFYALNPLLAFTDRSCYCIEAGMEVSCILWTQELTKLAATKDPYARGTELYFQKRIQDHFFLISALAPKALSERDTAFISNFAVSARDSLTGSLEKYSNLYLYEVERRK